ncbi:MAG: PKD domain-containing protein [Verrucomicrobia bacterium]|nr:PKD domain-containing protein [Verrucomicrobiota bacterium]
MKPHCVTRIIAWGLLLGTVVARGAPVAEPLYTVPYEYSALLFDADRASLYVAWPGRRVLARHDLVTGVEGDALALSLTPTDVAMTPNGRWLFVGETQVTADGYPTEQPGKIAEIDLETFTLVREIEYAYSPRHLLARDDRILVVVNPNPVNLENEVRLFHAVTGASAGRLVVSGYPLTLDPSQQSIIGYGLGNISDPNVRVFLVAEPLGFGVHWKSPGTDMGSPVYASPDGQLLVTEGSFYRGAANQAAEDMTLIRTPETALGFNQVARFEPPEGRTFLIVGVDGLAFFRRDTLEPFATATVGNAMDAAYDGAWVYALALQDWTTVQISRLANPGLGMEGNQAPVASFSWSPVNPTDRDDVRFDASTSRDEDGAPGDLRFRWDFNSDGRFETELNPDPVTFHRFRAAGPQGVTLEVRDRLGATTRVTNQFTVTALPDPGEPGVAHAPWRIPLPSTSLVFDPVRPVLYAANLTNRSLVTLDLRTGQMRRQWQLDALVSGLAVRPDGSRLYVGLTLSDPTIYDAQGSGWIAEFDLEQGRKERAFAVELGPLSLVATDAGRIVVFGESTPEREIQLYEAASGALLSRQRLQDASALALHPGQAVMYAATAEAPLGLRRYWLDPDTGLLGAGQRGSRDGRQGVSPAGRPASAHGPGGAANRFTRAPGRG